jgi:hypothetical protein
VGAFQESVPAKLLAPGGGICLGFSGTRKQLSFEREARMDDPTGRCRSGSTCNKHIMNHLSESRSVLFGSLLRVFVRTRIPLSVVKEHAGET